MEVLARIPELSAPQVVAEAGVSPDSGSTGATCASRRAVRLADAPRSRRVSRGLMSPSIVILAVLAAAMWGAVWRSERLRLEAQRGRPDRLASHMPGGETTVGSH